MFVYANALQAVISSHERWATAKPATNDTVRRARDRAVSDIGNPPARERLPPETVRRRVNHAYEFRKSRVFARDQRVSAAPFSVSDAYPRDIHDIYKRNLREILKNGIIYKIRLHL